VRLAALSALAAGFALTSAQSAPAALSWGSGDEASAAVVKGCVPCFSVAVVVQGTGHVTGVSPGTSEAGRIECAPMTIDGIPWTCTWYFLWLDGDPTVILTPSGGTFSGWEPAPEDPTSTGCPQIGPGPNDCTLTLDNTPLGTCIQATFTGTGTEGTCTVPIPPGCAPFCGPPPVMPPVAPPPPGTGVPAWNAACTIVGSAGIDTLRGTSGRNVLCGRGGNDKLFGNGGADVLRGEGGNDKLFGGAGIDRLDGGLGIDTLDGNGGKDQVRGGGGADTFYAKDGIRDALVGGPGRDRARVDRVDSLSAIERRF
jgi:RTX calcium-binding nonapeptide repeat (4 copies)